MTKMHISEKLTNWISWASDGQKAVITEARDEIIQLQNRIETLQEVVREDHAFALELFKERDRLREELKKPILVGKKQIETLPNSDSYWVYPIRAALKGDE